METRAAGRSGEGGLKKFLQHDLCFKKFCNITSVAMCRTKLGRLIAWDLTASDQADLLKRSFGGGVSCPIKKSMN